MSVMLSCSETRQDRQCTYNVTLRGVRATIVAVEKKWVLHNLSVCICSLRYPACNAHAPYCHLWSGPLCNIFPHYLINSTIFERKKKVTEHKMCVLIFSTTFFWNISHCKDNSGRFARQIFEKYSNIKFYENPSSGSRVVPCGRTDGHTDRYDEANSSFSQFCERV